MLWKTPAKENERNPSIIAFPNTKQRKNTLFCQWFKNSLQLFPGEGPCRGPWGTQHHPVGTQPGSAPWKEPLLTCAQTSPSIGVQLLRWLLHSMGSLPCNSPCCCIQHPCKKAHCNFGWSTPSFCYQGSNTESNATHGLEEQEQQCFNCCNSLQIQCLTELSCSPTPNSLAHSTALASQDRSHPHDRCPRADMGTRH